MNGRHRTSTHRVPLPQFGSSKFVDGGAAAQVSGAEVDALGVGVGQLTPDLKMARRLRDVLGLSYNEIADSLERTVAAVRWRLLKGREEVQLALAREGERLGLHSAMIADHIVFPVESRSTYPYTVDGKHPSAGDALETFSILGVVAGATERLRLVTSVLVLPYRNPVLTAKMISTIDNLSDGRVILGVGSGWSKVEYAALGRFGLFDARGAVTDESIEVMRRCWEGGEFDWNGTHFTFRNMTFGPVPVQGRLPIWVGGGGEKRTLAIVVSVLLPVQPKKIGRRGVFIMAVSTMIFFFSSGERSRCGPGSPRAAAPPRGPCASSRAVRGSRPSSHCHD